MIQSDNGKGRHTMKKISKKTTTAKKTAPKYTRLNTEDIGELVSEATDGLRVELSDDILERFEVEESEDYPGAYFVTYPARKWIDAVAFAATMEAAAANLGYMIATPNATWRDGLKTRGRRRLVDVFVAHVDLYDRDGKPRA